MADEALVTVFERNAFYRRLYLLALVTFFLALLVIGFLCWVLFFLVSNPDEPLYLATNPIGQLIDIIPTDRAGMSTEDAIAWATDALENSLSYDFVNYRAQFQDAQKYFTEYGWQNYMEGLTASNNLIALTERSQVVIAQVVPPVKVLSQGLLSGSWAWKLEVPVLITYFQPPYDKPAFSNPLIFTVIVQRQPVLQSYKGLGILQLIGRMALTPQTQPQQISNTPTG